MVNDLLKEKSGECTYRVLWIDPEQIQCYLVDVESQSAFPVLRKISEINDEIVLGDLHKIKEDPYFPRIGPDVSPAHLEKRNHAWNLISEMVTQEPDVYDRDRRGEMVKLLLEQHNTTKPTVYKNLRRYWQLGKTPNALLPNYHKSGGKGKEKSAGEAKRGRPPIYGEEGVNVDESTKKTFRIALEKYYLTRKKNSLPAAYEMMVKEFFASDIYYENGIQRVLLNDLNMIPTLRQFKYWYYKEYKAQDTIIAREGRTKFEKDHRAILGSSTFETYGPGSRFQIDATVVNVYLVSRYNPDWIIGRPIMYMVVDVYSRMVVGMYIGLEGPSWLGAMMALANAAFDKKSFCAQHGIPIEEEMWPCTYLPEILLADRGEIEGVKVESLMNAFHIHVENAAPYRGDMKGIVEQYFDTHQERVKPFLPGYVEKDFGERGSQDYRLAAKLTIEQFTQIMIKQVLYHNNKHYLNEYIRDEDMIRDGVEPIPIEIWKWGIKNRSGKLRSYPEDQVRMHLLPRGKATVTFKGIQFEQMRYSCDRALREGWFTNARAKGSWKVTVHYDPRNVSIIYLWDENSKTFEECHLLEYVERYENKSLDEVRYLLAKEKMMKHGHQSTQLQAKVDFMMDVESIVKQAVKETNKRQTNTSSKAQRVKSIKEHRKVEREERRKEESFVQPTRAEKQADIIPFSSKQEEEDFSRPSIKEFLRREKERKGDE
ncbi:Mu transposase C-terminal domain-containing protein [Tumebacillus amylolyticus]|nr:Mu transposase C-terminal domain-containing protein [Tumebacillus amylolyticus]